jgi:hypothetical protein
VFHSSIEATDMTLQTTALGMALILLGAAAALQIPSAVTSEPATATPATTIQAGDEGGFEALAETKPLSGIWQSSQWPWKWIWTPPSGERFFGADVSWD